jgi:hypothetical protein
MNLKTSWAKFAGFLIAGSVLAAILLATGLRKSSGHLRTIAASPQPNAKVDAPRWEKVYAQLPLGFEENRGQASREVRFVSHGSGYALSLTPRELDLAIQSRDARLASPLHRAAALRAYREAHKAPKTTVVRMQLEGANPAPAIAASDKLSGKTNYFVGNDSKKWVTDVPSFARVKYSEIYPGVDVEFYGNQRHLEYDFTVAPGADAKAIALKIDGAESVEVSSQGDLILRTPEGDAKLQKPVMYQLAGGERREVAGNYKLAAGNRVTFAVAKYDPSLPLVIDPVLSPVIRYGTYLGGTGDETGFGIAVDANGDAFIGGFTSSLNFPIKAATAFQTSFTLAGGCGFVTEIDPTGTQQLYSTFLCGATPGNINMGNAFDEVFAIAVDGAGKVYVTGTTSSIDFPTKNGLTASSGVNGDVFLSKLDPSASGPASLVYSTFFGGLSGSEGLNVAVDNAGSAYIVGQTFSAPGPIANGSFPITAGAFQANLSPSLGNAFLTRIDTTQAGDAGLIYSTYLGGNGANNHSTHFFPGDLALAVAVDDAHNAYLGGITASTDFPPMHGFQPNLTAGNTQDAGFVTRIDTTKANAASLIYSTYLSGSVLDEVFGLAIGPNNVVYVTGMTDSLDFPTTPGAFQTTGAAKGVAFVTLIDTSMSGTSSLKYSTFFGGTGGDNGFGIATDSSGNTYVAGTTASGNFPISPGAVPRTIPNAKGTPFVLKLNPQGMGIADRIYASYFGGSGDGTTADMGEAIAVDSHGNAYITGATSSGDMPTTAGAFQTSLKGSSDAFVAKLPLVPPVAVSPASVDFGTQLVGSVTAPQTVTLTNNETTAITIVSIAVTAVTPPAPATDFKISSNTCGNSLAASASCTVSVTFTPSHASAESATLVFTDADGSSPQTAALTGTGTATAPVTTFTPTSLNLGGQLLSTTSAPAQAITLKNNGNATLNIASIAASGDFHETDNCGNALPATMSCAINVTFTPTATGARSGNITVTDNANGSPQTAALSGTGTDFTIVAPASVIVPRHSNMTFNVTVMPISGFNQAVTISCTGGPASTTCTPMQPSVTPDGVNPINDPITVASTSSVPQSPMQVPPPSGPQIVLAAMGLALIAVAYAARRFRKRMGLAGAMLVVFAVTGCSGGGGSVMATITLTGTSGGVTHSTTVALTLEQ